MLQVLIKDRTQDNQAEVQDSGERYDGKDLYIPDDIDDTCGTTIGVGELAKKKRSEKRYFFCNAWIILARFQVKDRPVHRLGY